MNRLLIATMAIAIAGLPGCADAVPDSSPSGAPNAAADHSKLMFRVGNGRTKQSLPGVKVSFIASDGAEIPLGTTDTFGTLTIAKNQLRERGAKLVLFSHEGFFTGAFRVERDAQDFYEFDERYIQLAVHAI